MAHEQTKLIIIGAGFGGLAMAIRLKQEGINGFVILDRADDVGGAWHHNTYPGCRCDVPSHLYSLSFAPNPNWSTTYSPQPEIRDYLRARADRFGIRPHLRMNVEVETADWWEEEQAWQVETSEGTFISSLLVSGMGPLSEPRYPDLPGFKNFKGKAMHSARWDHDYELGGKRVASIGTGASAIQYVPEIKNEVEQLYVFQRTAPLMDRIEKVARGHIERQVPDPELREKVTPDYTIGCKRMVPSNRWYPALSEPNVDLVTSGISEVRSTRSSTATASSGRSMRPSSAPGFTSPACRSASRSVAGGAPGSKSSGKAARGLTSEPRFRDSRTSSCSSVRIPGAVTHRWFT